MIAEILSLGGEAVSIRVVIWGLGLYALIQVMLGGRGSLIFGGTALFILALWIMELHRDGWFATVSGGIIAASLLLCLVIARVLDLHDIRTRARAPKE